MTSSAQRLQAMQRVSLVSGLLLRRGGARGTSGGWGWLSRGGGGAPGGPGRVRPRLAGAAGFSDRRRLPERTPGDEQRGLRDRDGLRGHGGGSGRVRRPARADDRRAGAAAAG